jgi:hypothetical protein
VKPPLSKGVSCAREPAIWLFKDVVKTCLLRWCVVVSAGPPVGVFVTGTVTLVVGQRQ